MNILFIEDDAETAAFVCRGLSEAGDTVYHHQNAADALRHAANKSLDVIVFDRLLPDMDGIEAVRLLRKSGVTTPVIMLTALAGIDDRVSGLEAGADDYLVKPFSFAELYARLKALARRQPMAAGEAPQLQVADLTIDRTTHKVTRAGQVLDLLPREYRILEYLVQHKDQLVTKTMLLEKIWGYNFDPKTSLVHTHVSRMRSKVDRPFDTELIQTVRGSGYKLTTPQNHRGRV